MLEVPFSPALLVSRCLFFTLHLLLVSPHHPFLTWLWLSFPFPIFPIFKTSFTMLASLLAKMFLACLLWWDPISSPMIFDPHKGPRLIKKNLRHWRELHNRLLIQRIHSLHVKPFPLISKIKDKPIWPHALAHSCVDTLCTFHVFPGSSFGVHLEAQQGSVFWGPSKPHQCLHSVPDLSP